MSLDSKLNQDLRNDSVYRRIIAALLGKHDCRSRLVHFIQVEWQTVRTGMLYGLSGRRSAALRITLLERNSLSESGR